MAEVPGPGTYERYKTVEGSRATIMEEEVPRNNLMTGSKMNATFKNCTTRDDYLSYLATEKKKSKDVSPSRYFKE